jgi:hypothetical protein
MSMSSEFKPTLHEHLAIEARLNMLLGAAIYDRLLMGFRVVSVKDGVLLVLVDPENLAAVNREYSMHRRAIRSVVLNPNTKSNASPGRTT